MLTVYTFTPPVNSWQKYTSTFNISSSGNYMFGFYGTINNPNYQNAIQNIQITGSGSSGSGTYSYSQCQQAAIDAGYRYFALQNVNPQTALGYCGVSNNQPGVTINGTSYIPSGQKPLWASNTAGQTGNSASLTTSGALSVINSSGTSVFSTPNSNAQPSNYLGCYGDGPNRAMYLYNNGAQQYNLQQCQQIAQQTGNQYFGLQNSTSGTTAQCAISNNLAQSKMYGKAGNCTKISNGSWSGGGYSNAVYSISPQSIYFLILQDDGNMVVYRGSGPNDIQGVIWATGTNRSNMQQSNPNYAAAKGKYGQNWIASGSTLAAGDFVGSTSGNMALIMQSDGNLVLYTFTNVLNCQKMSDGNMGGGVGANALYDVGKVGIPGNMNQTAFIDQNAELHVYPADNVQYSNNYTMFQNMNSTGNDISGAYVSGTTVDTCKSICDYNSQCAGFVFQQSGNVCFPKTSGMYPSSQGQPGLGYSVYVRGKSPINPPMGVSTNTNSLDSITYQNYVNGGPVPTDYGLSKATAVEQQQLSSLQKILNDLSSKIINITGTLGANSAKVDTQMNTNVDGLGNYVSNLSDTTNNIQNFDTNYDNILNDSEIITLQKNYEYLFWTILASGSVLVSMNLLKK